jgi:type II secretory pathway pseudopilin PulG
MNQRHRHSRGFLMADVILGMLLIGLILGLMTSTMSMWHRSSVRLLHERRATAEAERALTLLRAGQSSATDAAAILLIEPLSGDAPQGLRWTRVTASVEGRSASLIGLLPEVKP